MKSSVITGTQSIIDNRREASKEKNWGTDFRKISKLILTR